MTKRIIFTITGSLFVLVSIFFYQSYKFSDSNLHVVFCHVGQGDSIFIRTPENKQIVIDGGQNALSLECLNRHMPFWDKTLDLVFLTHPDLDHYGGLADIFESYEIKEYGYSNVDFQAQSYQILLDAAKTEGSKNRSLAKGDSYKFKSGVVLSTLWPSKDYSGEKNDMSLIQILKFGSFEVLLTGDASVEFINTIMDTQKDVDILKLGHHGSKTSTNRETFQFIKPELSVISAGKNNKFGHPHKEVLDALSAYNLQYKTTFESDIEIVSNGKDWWIVE